jgi:hypothetical protein
MKRRIITFVDETVIPYGDNYEFAVQVMTAYTQVNWGGYNRTEWETWAELPNGEEYVNTHPNENTASLQHEVAVAAVCAMMDKIDLPAAERRLHVSGLKNIDGIGGYLAEKDGVTYIRKEGEWIPLKTATTGDAEPSCVQCRGSGSVAGPYGMTVGCDCKRGVRYTEVECPDCSSGWFNPDCRMCGGKGTSIRRKT